MSVTIINNPQLLAGKSYDEGDKEDMENDELKRASNMAKIQEKLAKRNGSK